MEVRARRLASLTDSTNRLSLGRTLSTTDVHVCQVGIESLPTIAVVKDDQIAVPPGVVSSPDCDTGR